MNFLKTFTKLYFKGYRPTIKDFLLSQGISFFWITLLLLLSEFYTLVFFIAILFTSFVSLLDQKLFMSKNELLMFSLEKTKLYFPTFFWQRVLLDDLVLNIYIFFWIVGASAWSGNTIYIGFTLLIYFGFKVIEFFYFNEKDNLDNNLITAIIVFHVFLGSILFIVYTVFRPKLLLEIFNISLVGFSLFFCSYGLLSYAILNLLRKRGRSENRIYHAFLMKLRKWDIHYYKEVTVFISLYIRNLFSVATIMWIWVIGNNNLASRLGILIIYSFLLTMRTFSVKEKRKHLNIDRDHLLKEHLTCEMDIVQWLKKKKRISTFIGTIIKALSALIISLIIGAFYIDIFLLFLLVAIIFTSTEFHLMLIKERIEQSQSYFIRFLTCINLMLLLYLEFYTVFGIFLFIVTLFETLRYRYYLRRFV